MANENLRAAKSAKNDEFYTRLEDMEGDHVTPWTEGGHTVYSNLQMLCKKCNREKGSK